ncbi:MAG: hypothetical protein R2755_23625 [Acidimicrobiales bacterium]
MRTLPAAHAMLHLLEREHPTQPADDVADEAAHPDDEGPIEWRFRRIPIEVADAFAGGIVAARRTTILTSATLRAGGSFTFLGHRLGLRITDAANPGPHTTTDTFDDDAFNDEGDEVDGTDGYGTLGSGAAPADRDRPPARLAVRSRRQLAGDPHQPPAGAGRAHRSGVL